MEKLLKKKLNVICIKYMILFTGILFSIQIVPSQNCFAGGSSCHDDIPGHFLYYKLSISRSQEWCLAKNRPEHRQCKREYIVHGLWPQCQSGYPDDCKVDFSYVDEIDKDFIYTFMPSDFLIDWEWERHGTCSGLKRSGYYQLTHDLFFKIKLPSIPAGIYTEEAIKKEVSKANQGKISAKGIDLACDENRNKNDSETLDEIRICMDRAGEFIDCTEFDNSCQKDKIRVRWME